MKKSELKEIIKEVIQEEVSPKREKLAEKLYETFLKSLAKNKMYYDSHHGELTIKDEETGDELYWIS